MLRNGILLCLPLSLGLLAPPARHVQTQQGEMDQEWQLKAGYLWHFGRYVQWPEKAIDGAEDTFVIGVLGKDPFDRYLREIEQRKTVQGKKIVVHQFRSMDEYKPCHILFISAAAVEGRAQEKVEDRLNAALQKTKGAHVLLVSDTPGLARKGVTINYVYTAKTNPLKLEINLDAAKRAGLTLSSRLLNLEKDGLVITIRDNEQAQTSGPQ